MTKAEETRLQNLTKKSKVEKLNAHETGWLKKLQKQKRKEERDLGA